MNAPIALKSPRIKSSNAILFVVCLAQFMVILDVAIVNVALPSMRDGLHFSTTGLQWVVNAYTLTFAGFLMLGARSADLLGRRRVFLAGTALFALCSLVCALASSRGLLIGARTLQGFAGAIVIALGLRVIPAGSRHEGPRNFDATGAVLVTAGLVALTYGIVRTDTLGWGAPGVLVPLAAAVLLLAAFALVEARFAAAPLVPLSIFRHRRLRAANAVVVLLYAARFTRSRCCTTTRSRRGSGSCRSR